MRTLIVLISMFASSLANAQVPARTLPEPIPQKVEGSTNKTKQPTAKSADEYKAFQDALQKPDAASSEAAADQFAKKYPKSELRGVLYQRTVILYQQAQDPAKIIDAGRKGLAIEPDNGPMLTAVAAALANATKPTDADKDARYAEARKDADHLIELAAKGQAVPPGTPVAQVADYQKALLSLSYSSLAQMDITDKNYPAAETELSKAVEAKPDHPDAVTLYRLAWVLQREGKNQQALSAAQKCVAASNSPEVTQTCTNMQTGLQKMLPSAPAGESK